MPKLDRGLSNNPTHKNRRRDLRTHGTAAEAVLWKRLQKRQILGKRFRRQFGIGPYIVDFYCPECGVIVELDGEVHSSIERAACDFEREEYLCELGMKIVRFRNKVIFENIDAAVENIIRAVEEASRNQRTERTEV